MKSLPLLTLFVFATSALCADSYTQKESFSRTSPFDADGKVSLHNVNGNIQVETWDKNEISIEGEKTARTEEELKLIDLKISLSPSNASITVTLPRKSGFFSNTIQAAVNFRIKVPARASLEDIKTVNSNVALTGLEGKLHVETVNGQIHGEHLGASTHFETVNGGIRAQFDRLVAGQSITLKTVNGRIHSLMPADAGMKLSSSVVNGTVDSDFALDGQKSSHKKRLAGIIGDGRAALDASSVNGSIRLEKL